MEPKRSTKRLMRRQYPVRGRDLRCRLLELPIEIFLMVLDCLPPCKCPSAQRRSRERPPQSNCNCNLTMLSRCSKSLYRLTFPFRKIHRLYILMDEYRRFKHIPTGPSRLAQSLKYFDDGQWLAPLRHYLTSITFKCFELGDLAPFVALIHRFSHITSIRVVISSSVNLEKNIYVKVLSCLSSIPYYDNIRDITFSWRSSKFDGGWNSEGSEFSADYSPEASCAETSDTEASGPETFDLGLTAHEFHQRKAFKRKTASWEYDGYQLGNRWVSNNALANLALNRKIRLPKNLRSFKLDISRYEHTFSLPLLHCRAITALYITFRCHPEEFRRGHGRMHLVKHARVPRGVLFEYPSVKALTLNLKCGSGRYSLDHLSTQFPNLISLILRYENTECRGGWHPEIPNLPKLKCLTLLRHWCRDPDLEWGVRSRLQKGEFPALQMLKSSSPYWSRPKDTRTGIISRGENSYGHDGGLKFEWHELEDISYDSHYEDSPYDSYYEDTPHGNHYEDISRDNHYEDISRDNHDPRLAYLDGYGTRWWSSEDLAEIEIEPGTPNNIAPCLDPQSDGTRCEEKFDLSDGPEYDSERERLRDDLEAQLTKDEMKNLRKRVKRRVLGNKKERQRIARQWGDPEEIKNRSDEASESEEENNDNKRTYNRVHFERTVDIMDADSESSSLEEKEGEEANSESSSFKEEEGEEADDEIGYLSQDSLVRNKMDPEDSDEYGDDELSNNSQGSLDEDIQDFEFDPPSGSRYCFEFQREEESQTDEELDYLPFDSRIVPLMANA
ncbi:hypothetical protein TWF281_004428 [Arthrobotrys megalospora]